jgi:hypothetical protein
MSPFASPREYEHFVYSLPHQFSSVIRSTLIIAHRSRLTAELSGELAFEKGYRPVAYERLSWDNGPIAIVGYSYEFWQGDEKRCWYDSQPHPGDESLSHTHLHHKHVPPDIKHNRVPAAGLAFARPNLPLLIREIEALLAKNDRFFMRSALQSAGGSRSPRRSVWCCMPVRSGAS